MQGLRQLRPYITYQYRSHPVQTVD